LKYFTSEENIIAGLNFAVEQENKISYRLFGRVMMKN
jgi:hypothetical protein